jgi:hypothetical protein
MVWCCPARHTIINQCPHVTTSYEVYESFSRFNIDIISSPSLLNRGYCIVFLCGQSPRWCKGNECLTWLATTWSPPTSTNHSCEHPVHRSARALARPRTRDHYVLLSLAAATNNLDHDLNKVRVLDICKQSAIHAHNIGGIIICQLLKVTEILILSQNHARL